jgi:hypothetical protein
VRVAYHGIYIAYNHNNFWIHFFEKLSSLCVIVEP